VVSRKAEPNDLLRSIAFFMNSCSPHVNLILYMKATTCLHILFFNCRHYCYSIDNDDEEAIVKDQYWAFGTVPIFCPVFLQSNLVN
jgi:hypothetical protein